MSYENKPLTGVLFRNDRKKTDRHPDYTGRFVGPDGEEYWLSGWLKDGARGKYLSLAATAKERRQGDEESQDDGDPF